jgi:hypothetical protein
MSRPSRRALEESLLCSRRLGPGAQPASMVWPLVPGSPGRWGFARPTESQEQAEDLARVSNTAREVARSRITPGHVGTRRCPLRSIRHRRTFGAREARRAPGPLCRLRLQGLVIPNYMRLSLIVVDVPHVTAGPKPNTRATRGKVASPKLSPSPLALRNHPRFKVVAGSSSLDSASGASSFAQNANWRLLSLPLVTRMLGLPLPGPPAERNGAGRKGRSREARPVVGTAR